MKYFFTGFYALFWQKDTIIKNVENGQNIISLLKLSEWFIICV